MLNIICPISASDTSPSRMIVNTTDLVWEELSFFTSSTITTRLYFIQAVTAMIEVGNGLIYASLSLILYGVWGLVSKLATNYIDPKSALVYETISALLTSLLLVATQGFKIQSNSQGIFYAMLVGVMSSLATFCFFVALKYSSVSIVVPLTALYPSITALLALFFLKEPITFRQVLGIILATITVTLFSGK